MRSTVFLLCLALAGAGCSGPADDADEDEDGPQGDPIEPDAQSGIWFNWIDPDDSEVGPQALRVVEASSVADGVGLIRAHDQTHEGWDFRLQLEVRFSGGFGRHAYDAALSAPGTFRFQYEEQPFWAGRHICGVSAVSDASYVKVTSWTPTVDRFAGEFLLDFEGTYSQSDCDDPGAGGDAGGHVRLTNGVWR